MKDKLENFFNDHKDAFDYLPKDDANNWNQMEQRLDAQQGSSQQPRRYIGRWLMAATATAAAVLLLFSYFNTPEQLVEPDYTDMVSLIGLEKDQYFPDLTLQNPEGEMIPFSRFLGFLQYGL